MSTPTDADPRLLAFERERGHLVGVAYRMLGSLAEAEDVVQNAWMRLAQGGAAHAELREPRAYFTTIVVRLSLDALKSARVRRESYVGPWLPEPVLTDAASGRAPEPRDVGSISLAFLVLLETLSPLERAAFLLQEVFEWTGPEIGTVLGRDEAAVRQLVSRARAHVEDGAPRYAPTREAHQRILEGFLATLASGDVPALAAMLAEDATVHSDGGGRVRAARKVVRGRLHAAKLLVGILRHASGAPEVALREINGLPSVVWSIDGVIGGVLSLETDGALVHAVHLINSPDKLVGLARKDA